MTLALLLFVSIYPIIGGWLFLHLSRLRMQTPVFLSAVAGGVLSTILAATLQSIIPVINIEARLEILFDIFVRIAFVEELMRFIVLRIMFAALVKFFKTKLTLPLQTACGLMLGLAFSSIETALIITTNVQFGMIRIFTAAPLHGACGGRCAMAAAKDGGTTGVIRHFGSAVLLHGFYNAMLVREGFLPLVGVLLAIMSFVRTIKQCRNVQEEEVSL
ncbi:MAG: PrsW family intramembrane metalloprotease [Spirochaetaceae bacterium]|jgi:uncharacterized membrane protein|nr:PrsW family intramembrane metalloprotease [Spirochaetaceae bacterium]